MQTIFSTTDVPARDRFAYWHDVACRMIVDHDSVPECRASFCAELSAAKLADVGVVSFENAPMEIAHTARHIGRATDDALFVCRQVAGGLVLEQDGREAVLQPDDVVLLDPRLPYGGRFLAGSRLLVLQVPRRLLEARIGRARTLLLRPGNRAMTESRLLSEFLAILPTHVDGLGANAAPMVREHVLDLVALSLTGGAPPCELQMSSARAHVLVAVRSAIEARLGDWTLDVATVAACAGVSARYANAVLAQQGTSVVRLIQARRLERCRLALEDPSQRQRTISEIAHGWGFSDMTHFARRFRATYGLSPRAYRLSKQRPR